MKYKKVYWTLLIIFYQQKAVCAVSNLPSQAEFHKTTIPQFEKYFEKNEKVLYRGSYLHMNVNLFLTGGLLMIITSLFIMLYEKHTIKKVIGFIGASFFMNALFAGLLLEGLYFKFVITDKKIMVFDGSVVIIPYEKIKNIELSVTWLEEKLDKGTLALRDENKTFATLYNIKYAQSLKECIQQLKFEKLYRKV